jgi:hypothetical protein
MGWKIEGDYFEACNCEVACPCVFLSSPTTGDCTALVAWHIEKGQSDGVNLDGLNALLAAHSPGHMTKVKWKVALYIDASANPTQTEALTRILGGQAGGVPAALAPFIGQILGVKSVPIEFKAEGKRRTLHIPQIAEMEIEAIAGQGGADVVITNHPLTAVPGQPAVVGKSKQLSYHDHGYKWELSEKNGFYSPFAYNGP